jgi:GNAT superfamily N-acetyltransferase
MSHDPRIRHPVLPCDSSDKDSLSDFQREYFGTRSRQCNEAFAQWLFESNPHRDRNKPVFWVCKRDGIVVGQQASVPVLLKVGDQEYRASWGIDLMVHREWRLKGVAPALSAAYESSADILLGLGMSSAAVRSYSRAGWSDMGRLGFAVRPLDVRACAQALQGRTQLARLVPNALVGGSSALLAGMARGLKGCSLEPIREFDERVEGVWQASANDYHVLVKRDFTSLHWRFDQFPEPGRYKRYYMMRRSRALGYAVVRMDRWRGHSIGRIVDYLGPRKYLSPLLALLIEEMRTRGATAVFVEHLNKEAAVVLSLLGCFRVTAVTQFMLKVQPQAAGVAGMLNEAGCWFATRGDSDSDMPEGEESPVREGGAEALSGRPEREPLSA